MLPSGETQFRPSCPRPLCWLRASTLPQTGSCPCAARTRATSILEVAEPHRYTGAGTLSVSGSFLVRETGAVKNCSRYGQAVLVPGAVSAASGSPFQRAELAA